MNASAPSPAVTEAANWIMGELDPPRPLVPMLRRRFGLTAAEACEALALVRSRKAH